MQFSIVVRDRNGEFKWRGVQTKLDNLPFLQAGETMMISAEPISALRDKLSSDVIAAVSALGNAGHKITAIKLIREYWGLAHPDDSHISLGDAKRLAEHIWDYPDYDPTAPIFGETRRRVIFVDPAEPTLGDILSHAINQAG